MNCSSRRHAAVVAGVAVACAAVAACSSAKPTNPVAPGGSSAPVGSTAGAGGAGGGSGDSHTAVVTITAADGCTTDRASYGAGGLSFKITNKDATGVSEVELLAGERIIGEKENLPPGFSGTFAVNVDPGDYTVFCPGAKSARTPLKITGTASSSANTDTHALLVEGTENYGRYVSEQAELLVDAVKPLSAALIQGDLDAARTAYAKARPFYERIEPVAESFTTGDVQLDPAIDAREGDVPAAKWTGFHRIEKGLFQDRTTTGLASYGRGLLANTEKLEKLVEGLSYQPAELANGAVELLDEVSKTKITGEEERYSHIDLLDIQANVEGSEQAFANLQPALAKIDPALAGTVSDAFARVDAMLDKFRSSSQPSGFVPYDDVPKSDVTALAHAVQTIAEPLSRVASKVVNA